MCEGQLPHVGDTIKLFNNYWLSISRTIVTECWIEIECLCASHKNVFTDKSYSLNELRFLLTILYARLIEIILEFQDIEAEVDLLAVFEASFPFEKEQCRSDAVQNFLIQLYNEFQNTGISTTVVVSHSTIQSTEKIQIEILTNISEMV